MNRRRIIVWIAALSVGAAWAAAAGQAAAQYPDQIGGVSVASGDTTPGPHQDVPVTATVVDEAGNAIGGASCTFAIAQQPGADATVDTGPFVTDATGQATTTLHSGSRGGNIVVAASCCPPGSSARSSTTGGDVFVLAQGGRLAISGAPSAAQDTCGATLTAQVTVQVSTDEEAAPPASLPDTGGGGGPDAGLALVWGLAVAGALLALAGLTTIGLARRRAN